MKFEPLFAHLLKLFIDTDRVKKKKGDKQFSENDDERNHNDQNSVSENQSAS